MNFLLRPWTTSKLELTAVDELMGTLEVIFVILVVITILAYISESRKK